jgi:copper(I)-binding protein
MEMTMRKFLLAALLSTLAVSAQAQVDVTSAWARPAVPGQTATGAFMTLTSKEGARLVGAASTIAGVVEIHEMAMDGNVMRMRAVPAIELPAGRAVQLKPGGYHVMLMDLKRPLAVGEKVRVELRIETREKRMVTQPVDVEVRAQPPGKDNTAHKH